MYADNDGALFDNLFWILSTDLQEKSYLSKIARRLKDICFYLAFMNTTEAVRNATMAFVKTTAATTAGEQN